MVKEKDREKVAEINVVQGGILLGRAALLKGYISSDQLVEALETQKTFRKKGNKRDLEEILQSLGFLNEHQVNRLRKKLKKSKYRTIGKYLLIRELGKGAMGVVFLGKDRFTKRTVAVKVLPPSLAKNPRFIERFKREATATFNLEHKNLVQSFGLHRSGDFYYFAMEYIDGCTLRDIIKKEKQLDEKVALQIVREVTKALVYADRKNLVHRDIKPDNIMITREGIIKLCDLGLAKFLESDVSITQTGRAVGTPHYLSPEQAKGEEDIDIRSDIYGLGVNLYLMVCGTLPFNGPTAPVVLKKHILDPPEKPRNHNENISSSLEKLILKMMAKKREDRFQKPTDLLREIDSLLGKQTIPTPQQIKNAKTKTATAYSLPANLRPNRRLKNYSRKSSKDYDTRGSARKKSIGERYKVSQEKSTKTIMMVVIGVLLVFNLILLLVLLG